MMMDLLCILSMWVNLWNVQYDHIYTMISFLYTYDFYLQCEGDTTAIKSPAIVYELFSGSFMRLCANFSKKRCLIDKKKNKIFEEKKDIFFLHFKYDQ